MRPTNYRRGFFILAVLGASICTSSAQSSATFVGGSPIDPNGWNVSANWSGLYIPGANDVVSISNNAFVRTPGGALDFSSMTLGQGARLDVQQGHELRVFQSSSTSLFLNPNSLLQVFGRVQTSASGSAFFDSNSFVSIQGSSPSNRAQMSIPGEATLYGTIRVNRFGRIILLVPSSSSLDVQSGGRLLIEQDGVLDHDLGVPLRVFDGGEVSIAGTWDSTASAPITLQGPSATLRLNNVNASLPTTARAVTAAFGGRIIAEGKGSILSPTITGAGVRLEIDVDTEVRSFDSMAAVGHLQLGQNARMIYRVPDNFPLGNYSNSMGGIEVQTGVTGTFGIDGTRTFSFLNSATVAVSGPLSLGNNSTLNLVREGSNWSNGARLEVRFDSFNQWTTGTNSTLRLGPLTSINGNGIYNLSRQGLTLEMGTDTEAHNVGVINRLISPHNSPHVFSGASGITLNGGDFAGQLRTAGGLTIGGNMILRASQSYTGGTFIAGGATLTLTNAGQLGSGQVSVFGTLDASTTSYSNYTLEDLSGTGTVNSGTKNLDFTSTSSTPRAVGNTLNGTGTITKRGAGVSDFTGTISGASSVIVAAGTLLVNSPATLNTPITVASGATLGGGGRTGAVSLLSGSTIAPGNSIGTLTTGSQTWAGGGRYHWEITAATGTPGLQWDSVILNAPLTLTATNANPFQIQIESLDPNGAPGVATGFAANQTYFFRIATSTAGFTGFSADKFIIDSSGFNDGIGPGTWEIFSSGNDIMLSYTAVPEPSTITLALLALAAMAAWSRRQRQLDESHSDPRSTNS